MSVSRLKDYAGCIGIVPCEARSVAMDKGEWKEEPSQAMMVGSFVDAYFSGTLDVFKAKNPEIFTKKGELLSAYKHAETIIARIEKDEYIMKCLSGEKQVIMTANLFGCEWSIMMDSYIKDTAIVDLKIMAQINKAHWVKDYGQVSFVQYYGYLAQAAIYQKVVEINTGKRLPFFFAVASKEDEPDIEVIGVTDRDIDDELSVIEAAMPRVLAVRSGEVQPDKCGRCAYCRSQKKLTGPIHFSELTLSI
jgi:hypothetical protein